MSLLLLFPSSGGGPATHEGSGAATLPILTASGTAKRALKGSGTPSLPVLTASGTAKRGLKGSGTPTLPVLTASGAGKKARSGSGAATLPALTATGAGKKARSGSGAVVLPILTASGTAKRGLKGSGSPSLPILTADGAGSVIAPGVSEGDGTTSLPLLTASGVGVVVPLVLTEIPGPGGSGYPVYWQGKRRKRRLEEQPNLHLKKVLDDVVNELYGELTEDDVPPAVQAKAAKLVKPFVAQKDKKLAIPPPAAVDWAALERDATRVRQLIALWRKQEEDVEIEAEDEYLLLMG